MPSDLLCDAGSLRCVCVLYVNVIEVFISKLRA